MTAITLKVIGSRRGLPNPARPRHEEEEATSSTTARSIRARPASLWLSLAVLCLLAAPAGAADAVFQYATPVAATKGQSNAFLWIPPEAKQVRGVVMAGSGNWSRTRGAAGGPGRAEPGGHQEKHLR